MKVTMTEQVHEVCAFIAACRKRAGLSMSDLSRRSGVSVTHVSDVERGKKAPSVDMLFKLVEACGGTLKFEASFKTPPYKGEL